MNKIITVKFLNSEISLENGGEFSFNLNIAPGFVGENYYLYIDLYQLDNAVHPEGHIAWWRYDLDGIKSTNIRGSLTELDARLICWIANLRQNYSWINDWHINYDSLVLMVVIRSKADDAIVEHVNIPCAKTNFQISYFRRHFSRNWNYPIYDDAPTRRSGGCIRIYARDIFINDAVGNFCLETLRLLKQNNLDVQMYSENYNIWYSDIINSSSHIASDTQDQDIILYYYSTFDPYFEVIKSIKCAKKLFYYHGVTNPSKLGESDQVLIEACRLAFNQLNSLDGFDEYAANSKFNAIQVEKILGFKESNVRSVSIVPPKLVGKNISKSDIVRKPHPARLLYVGRIKPHKKIEHLLYLFSEFLALDDSAEMFIVGFQEPGHYWDFIVNIQNNILKIPSGKIKWLKSVEDDELNYLYCTSSAYISMSEDEGFCLPVYEAMNFNLPVFAFDLPAIRELGGDGIYLFNEKNFHKLSLMIFNLLNSGDDKMQTVELAKARANEITKIMNGRGVWEYIYGVEFT